MRVTGPDADLVAIRVLGDAEETYELKLSFGELALIYKSLQATKTVGAPPPQDDLLEDTIQLVDLALKRAREWPALRFMHTGHLAVPDGRELLGQAATEGGHECEEA